MNSIYDLHAPVAPAQGSPVKFPIAQYPSAASYLDAYAEEIARACKTIDPEAFDRAAAILIEAYSVMPGCSHAAMAARHQLLITCNATT